MKRFANYLILAAFSSLLFVMPALAQDKDWDEVGASAASVYVVSARAGGVNYVEGDVVVKRAEGTPGRLLRGEVVEVGDKVATGENGRAEILMNPGSFIRLNRDSEFEFETTTLDDLRIRLNRGTAIFEVFASDDFKVMIRAGGSDLLLVKSGVYRVDVNGSQQARLEVWKGRAEAGNGNATKISKGRAASVNNGYVSISKFSKNMDEFEDWSKARAKQIAKANRSLMARNLGNVVLNGYQSYSWNCYDSLGLWVFNRQFGTYSFLPFGYGWRSPYGFRLGTNTSICNYPSYFWRPNQEYRRKPGRGGDGNGNGNGDGDGTGSGDVDDKSPIINPRSRIDPGSNSPAPPFQAMEKSRSVPRARGLNRNSRFSNFPPSFGSGSRGSKGSPAPAPIRATKPIRDTKNQKN